MKLSQSVGLLLVVSLTGCASVAGKYRILGGAAIGGSVGAVGGAAFSPDEENRAINALVFGLASALVGGGIALLTDTPERAPDAPNDLRARELGGASGGREYIVMPNQKLPAFLKPRVKPVVIEEFVEKDRVSEEGTLHEPHKVYRIKRQAELYANPVKSGDTQ